MCENKRNNGGKQEREMEKKGVTEKYTQGRKRKERGIDRERKMW